MDDRSTLRLAFHPATSVDGARLSSPAKACLLAGLNRAAGEGEAPGALIEDDTALAGVRRAFIHPPQLRELDLPAIGVIFAVHPVPDRADVLNVIAFGSVVNREDLSSLYDQAVSRIYPFGHEYSRTFTLGVSHDIQNLKTVAWDDTDWTAFDVTWSAINSLTGDGTEPWYDEDGNQLPQPALAPVDPANGNPLGVYGGVDLSGLLSVPYDAPAHLAKGQEARLVVVYSLLAPPEGADFQTIDVHMVGRRSADAVAEIGRRVGRRNPRHLGNGQAETRAAAGRMTSTTGTSPGTATEPLSNAQARMLEAARKNAPGHYGLRTRAR